MGVHDGAEYATTKIVDNMFDQGIYVSPFGEVQSLHCLVKKSETKSCRIALDKAIAYMDVK